MTRVRIMWFWGLIGLMILITFQTGCTANNKVTEAIPKTVSDSNAGAASNTVGSDYPAVKEETTTKSDNKDILNVLKYKIICIDPGHGNPNHAIEYEPIAPSSNIMKPATAYGTTGITTKIPEYRLTMAVSLKLKDELLKTGAKVLMTRDNNNMDLGNIERAEIANNGSADLAIRIHADGIDDYSVTGISVLVPGSRYIEDAKLISNSRNAANLVLESLIKRTHAKSRGVAARDDLTGFNWSKVPVILIEMGFMTNPDEDKTLNTDHYQNEIVDGIVDGISLYFTTLESQ